MGHRLTWTDPHGDSSWCVPNASIRPGHRRPAGSRSLTLQASPLRSRALWTLPSWQTRMGGLRWWMASVCITPTTSPSEQLERLDCPCMRTSCERPVTSRGAEPPLGTVVLMHGFNGSCFSWRYVGPALAAAGYRAIAFDRPPFGLTQRPRTWPEVGRSGLMGSDG